MEKQIRSQYTNDSGKEGQGQPSDEHTQQRWPQALRLGMAQTQHQHQHQWVSRRSLESVVFVE